MKKLARFALWSWLLTKRLLKKPAFLILLLCVPLLSGAVALAARQESGTVRVALVCATDDPVARRSTDRLLHPDVLVRCEAYDSEAEAREALERGTVDAVWIFRDGVSEELENFVTGQRTRGLVLVVEREDNVFLRLAREQLAAAIYPEASFALFRDHLIKALGAPEDLPRETLEKYYSVDVTDSPIIVFTNADGSERQSSGDLLITPVRGLLSLLPVLAGLASCLYYYREEENGVYLRLSAGKRRALPLLNHMSALLPVAAAVLAALYAAGIATGFERELGLLLLYCLAVAAFCEVLRKLCRDESRLGVLIPVLMAAMLALCPIFAQLELPEALRRLFPPYYYLKGIYAGRFVWQLALYAAAAAALAMLLPERETMLPARAKREKKNI